MTTGREFRVIDTGIRGGRANMAFDQALIELRQEDVIPDTIRFLRFHPSALIGRHQILSHEVDLAYCRDHGIEVGRRVTGGGGLYLDGGQIGWELVFDRTHLPFADLGAAARAICEAAAFGLTKLGIAARYRPRNDIEVEGRKICGTGGFFDGNILFYQGTLLIDFDPAEMTRVLKIPAAKLAKRDLVSAGARIVTLRELLGDGMPDLDTIYRALLEGFAEGLGIASHWRRITPEEEPRAEQLFAAEIGTDDFVRMLDEPGGEGRLVGASVTTQGGTVRADIRLEGPRQNRIREILITGDFFVTPPRVILDLEATLRGVETAAANRVIETFFHDVPVQFLSLKPLDIQSAVGAALRDGLN